MLLNLMEIWIGIEQVLASTFFYVYIIFYSRVKGFHLPCNPMKFYHSCAGNLDAPPILCPIEAPLNFTYHTSGGSCISRISSITRCSQWARLSFHYQACPENPTKEASVSEIECIASWHSLGHMFFAARVGNRRGESYRCFIVDQMGTSGRIGISADASCQELTDIGAATTTLQYKQDKSGTSLPTSERWKAWWAMDAGSIPRVYWYWLSSYKGRNDSVWTCLESRRLEHFVAVRAHVRRGCQTGYQCVQVRDPHGVVVNALAPGKRNSAFSSHSIHLQSAVLQISQHYSSYISIGSKYKG
ncbi:unnamed protein product [Angiostrongylus costaricensis]|uniref:C-type lectin domain-containing protein n=1 Tax=Angiostrongylus costaricensis TaxID=334426 RepID=A0A158PEX0_ANGCS|nr:unnamed protein product [Angiostrongylus costaricensis]